MDIETAGERTDAISGQWSVVGLPRNLTAALWLSAGVAVTRAHNFLMKLRTSYIE